MKKIFIILVAMLILTGCEATYTIDIDNDFNETIFVTSSDSSQLSKIKEYDFYNPVYYDEHNVNDNGDKIPGVKYYKYEYSDGLTASYKFGSEYKRSRAVNYCFPSLTITEDEYVKIRTNVDFKCFKYRPDLDKLTINIVTKNEVVFNNADRVNGNTYTWIFDKNGSLKSIDIKYKNPNYKKNNGGNSNIVPSQNNQSNTNNNNSSDNKSQNNIQWYLYVLLSLSFIALFGIIILGKKVKER